MFVLDTDILTLAFHENERVLEQMEQSKQPVRTTIVNRVEVLSGRIDRLLKAANAVELLRAQAELSASEEHLKDFEILRIDEAAASLSERFRREKKTRTIRLKDLLVASVCLSHKATLVTRNTKDFKNVPGLKLENWAD